MKRLAIYAHYDAEGLVRRYVQHALDALAGVCSRIHFVSTAALPERELDKLRPLCAEVTLRENVGLDFGMWQGALETSDLSAYDELVLTNSSVFGPVRPLGPIFDEMASRDLDVWGMTESFEHAWHLQSYFLVFRRRVLDAAAFRRFFSAILPYRNKQQIIRSYELGLSRWFVEQGFALGAYVRHAALFGADGPMMQPLFALAGNVTCGFPAELVARGMPYVKVELLRDNPRKVELAPVYRVMRDAGYDPTLIEFDRPSLVR